MRRSEAKSVSNRPRIGWSFVLSLLYGKSKQVERTNQHRFHLSHLHVFPSFFDSFSAFMCPYSSSSSFPSSPGSETEKEEDSGSAVEGAHFLPRALLLSLSLTRISSFRLSLHPRMLFPPIQHFFASALRTVFSSQGTPMQQRIELSPSFYPCCLHTCDVDIARTHAQTL